MATTQQGILLLKILYTIIIVSLVSIKSFAQDEIAPKNQKDSSVPVNVIPAKKIKVVQLSADQKKQVKKYKKSNKAKKALIKNNSTLTDQQKKDGLKKLKNEREQKLEAILTPEQKEKIKQTKENKPRRGVTNMPNERTAK